MTIEIKKRQLIDNKADIEHCGEHASLATDTNGYSAWGYGDTQANADRDALLELFKVRERQQ